jgi:hypothetical protein
MPLCSINQPKTGKTSVMRMFLTSFNLTFFYLVWVKCDYCSHQFMAHKDRTVNQGGSMVEENLARSIYVTTAGTDTSTPNCGKGKPSNETDVTLSCRGSSEVTSEVRGIASCERIPSMRTDKCKCA